MNDKIKEIAEKFLAEENIPTKTAMLMASLGLTKNVGDIADIAYGINFNQHPYNEERQKQMVDYLGYVMLNWQILALSTGLNADEIAKRFAAEWLTKRTGKASIKDLLKHLKANVRTAEAQAPTATAPTNSSPVTNRTTTTETTTAKTTTATRPTMAQQPSLNRKPTPDFSRQM